MEGDIEINNTGIFVSCRVLYVMEEVITQVYLTMDGVSWRKFPALFMLSRYSS